MRAVTARGGALNAAFLSGAEGLVLLQGLLATALLGPSAIGLYGVVTTTAMTIVALRRVGIDEAFVQQAAQDEEAEFQRAFGVELAVGLVASLAIALLAPVLAAVYGDDRLLALTLGVAYLPVAFSLQAPQWIFFRRMDFLRLRLLQAIVPLGTVLVSVPLLLAGVGVWALVIGPFCAHVAAVAAAAAVSPYRLRPRFERAAARRYLRFSWPVFATAVAALAVAQGQVALFGLSDDGLAAAGWITLAATLTRYADRADQIVATTIYPAIVRVRDRVAVLEELFAKSNRLTLMWAFPFGAGLALFGSDLVGFVLGDEWEPAVVLLGGLAVATALQQLGYNWFAFYRARGESRPQAVESAWFAGSFAALVVPATLAWGSWGFVGRPDRVHDLRARGAPPLRAAAAAGRAARRDRAAGGAAGAGGDRAGAGPAAGAVGRGAAAGAGAGGAGAVAGRARARDPAARGRPARRAVGLPAPGRRAAARGRAGGGALVKARGALLWAAAALISGFTMRRYLEPFDEGLLMQAASRILDGQWPYADFGWPYGPGQPSRSRGCRGCSSRPSRGGGRSAWPPTRPPRWRCGRSCGRSRGTAGRWRRGWRRPSRSRSPRARTRSRWRSRSRCAPCSPPPATGRCSPGRSRAGGVLAARRGGRRRAAVVAALLARRAEGGARGVGRRRPRRWRRSRCSTRRSRRRRARGGSPTSSWGSRPATARSGGCRSRSPTTGRCAAGRRGRCSRTSRTCSASTCRCWLVIVALGAALAAAVRRPARPELAGVLVLAAGSALYLLSRADDLHAQPLALCACAAAPLALHGGGPPRARRAAGGRLRGARCSRARRTALSALLLPPELEPVHLAGVPGIRVPPAEAEALPALADRVQALVPPGEPIYVAPRRSDLVTLTDPLVHFLVRRPNVLSRDVSLQARPAEQARIVAALERERPAAGVRWTDPASARPEPNDRGRPSGSRALDEYLARAYRLDRRFGSYDVLVPR